MKRFLCWLGIHRWLRLEPPEATATTRWRCARPGCTATKGWGHWEGGDTMIWMGEIPPEPAVLPKPALGGRR